uniref:NADP-dependent oxidoreductase domain-containing protein n=1 Tax=Megaselia scalaris TaxID=36166 RepID=T1GUZ4_MEGSC
MGILKECISRAGPGRFDTVLCYGRYTLLDESLRDYIGFFKEQGLAVICASVHGIGLLSRGMKGILPTHPAPQEIKDFAKKAADICEEADVELGKLAMSPPPYCYKDWKIYNRF